MLHCVCPRAGNSARLNKRTLSGQSDAGTVLRYPSKVRRFLLGAIAIAFIFTGVAFGSTAPGSRAARIRDFANRWLGTPYLWGGDARGGIDCSGYSREMYREVFKVELPRTTKDQI